MTKELLIPIISGSCVIIASIITIFKEPLQSLFKKKNEIKLLEEAMRFNSEIDIRLRNILAEFNGSRIWVMQFHNGGHFYPTGKSIQKFSMIYEAVAQNAIAVQTQYQNIPISLFSHPLKQMLDKETYIFEESSDDENNSVRSVLLLEESKSMYCFSLKDLNNVFIGILGLSFNNDNVLTQKNIQDLQKYSHSIAGFLMTYLKDN